MLPAKSNPKTQSSTFQDEKVIRPGSWWRLAAETNPLQDYPAPEHGLVLMVSEVRVIDGDMHTIILHPHPLWRTSYRSSFLKLLAGDFLRDFTHAPDGESLREAEIAEMMDRVQAISLEMQTPPDPLLLLERQTENQADESAAPDCGADAGPLSLPGETAQVPAALLPSQDVIEAQKQIETRIAAFDAQKNWLMSKTDEIKSNMDLISAYQMEKVNASLASISQETSRAEALLQNVQTMRLFLGEDMEVTPLLDGKGADASEPLTLMQRMLYLDEEIIINDLLEGFSDRNMDPQDLSALFAQDFSLVERMLPYPRCAAIVRVRRNHRDHKVEGLKLVQLFSVLEEAKADMRVHILVRDGARLSMVTADETTSGAQRFFPSRLEIDALFQKRTYRGEVVDEILPDNVEYSDARAKHDQRALFYKRFLILMWGMHERTDIFGPFMEKGSNWLSLSTHSDHFRFVHDEEEVLGDGRASVSDYVASLNADISAGSRVLCYWNKVIDGAYAPALAESHDYRRQWKAGIDIHEDISDCLVQADGQTLFVQALAERSRYGRADRSFKARVTIARPRRIRDMHPGDIPGRELSDGLLCLDRATLEDLDHYVASRAARVEYLDYAHLLNRARRLLMEEKIQANSLVTSNYSPTGSPDAERLDTALHLWRSGNKWQWPTKAGQLKTIRKIADHLADEDEDLTGLFECQEWIVRGGVKANGDVFALCDTLERSLPGGAQLPWLEERIFSSVRTGKVRKTSIRHWEEVDRAGELTCFTWDDARDRFLDRCAPRKTFEASFTGSRSSWTERSWQVARGLFDSANAGVLEDIPYQSETPREVMALVNGTDIDAVQGWLTSVTENYRAPNRKVEMPRVRASLGLAWATGPDDIPRAWIIDVVIDMQALAHQHGETEHLKACLRSVYAEPQKVFDRIARGGSAVTLQVKSLKKKGSLAQAWSGHPYLSFDNEDPQLCIAYGMPKDDPRIGWKEALATAFAAKDVAIPDQHFSPRGWSAEALVNAAGDIGLLTAKGGADAIRACFPDA